MKQSCFQDLYFDFCLSIEFLLIFYDFQSNVLFLLMIVGSKYSSKWSSSQNWYNFIFISYGVSHNYLRVTSRFSEIGRSWNPSITCKINLIIFALLSFKSCELFINASFCSFKYNWSFRLRSFLTDPYFLKMMVKVILFIRWKLLWISSASYDYLVDTSFFLSGIFGLNVLYY